MLSQKVIKTSLAEYKPGVFTGNNESGWEPIGDKVMVLTDQVPDNSSGGIIYTDEHKEHMSLAAETGILVAVGEGAWKWNSDRTRPFEGRRPQPGDFVYIQRYAGAAVMGNDQQLYRLMDESCVAAMKYDHKE